VLCEHALTLLLCRLLSLSCLMGLLLLILVRLHRWLMSLLDMRGTLCLVTTLSLLLLLLLLLLQVGHCSHGLVNESAQVVVM
jgi:hypothetical protein